MPCGRTGQKRGVRGGQRPGSIPPDTVLCRHKPQSKNIWQFLASILVREGSVVMFRVEIGTDTGQVRIYRVDFQQEKKNRFLGQNTKKMI